VVNRSTVWGPQIASSFSKAGRPIAQWAGGASSGNSARREDAQRAGTVSSWLVVGDVQRTSTSTAPVSPVCCCTATHTQSGCGGHGARTTGVVGKASLGSVKFFCFAKRMMRCFGKPEMGSHESSPRPYEAHRTFATMPLSASWRIANSRSIYQVESSSEESTSGRGACISRRGWESGPNTGRGAGVTSLLLTRPSPSPWSMEKKVPSVSRISNGPRGLGSSLCPPRWERRWTKSQTARSLFFGRTRMSQFRL